MWWKSLLKRLGSRHHSSGRAARKRTVSCRPTLETLEGRDVPSYAVTDLGVTAGFVSSAANAFNQAGDVAGSEADSAGVSHAFLWHNGIMTDLGTTTGFVSSSARAINQTGDVAGSETDSAGVSHAFLWHNGIMTDLGTLGGANSSTGGLNDSDQVIGSSETGVVDALGNPIRHAFLWQNGVMTDLGNAFGGVNSYATGINNSGQVVGTADTGTINSLGEPNYENFLWQNGVMTDLGISSGEAAQINEAGQVVGNTRDEGYTMLPYLWQAGTTTYLDRNYDSINGYYLHAYALGMNASGVVVGWAQTLVPIPSGLYDDYGPQYIYVPEQHASVWQNGGPWDLGTLPNGHFSAAYSINTAGQILGVAQDSSGAS